MMFHAIDFQTNGVQFRAICSCGWTFQCDTIEECQSRAATHDLDDDSELTEDT